MTDIPPLSGRDDRDLRGEAEYVAQRAQVQKARQQRDEAAALRDALAGLVNRFPTSPIPPAALVAAEDALFAANEAHRQTRERLDQIIADWKAAQAVG